MKTIALWILAALAACAQDHARLTVLSYNIHHGEGTDGNVDLERIAAVIRGASPDFVALQEVDRNTRRTGGVDQALRLACLTGMYALYGRTMDYEGGLYGNAVLTRLPADGYTNHALPFTPGREPRAVMEVEAAGIRFFATHLDIAERDRLLEIPAIAAIAEKPAVPELLAGDMNGRPDSRTLEELRKTWQVAGPDRPLPTAPAGSPRWQIDYVLFRPAGRWRVVEVRVLDEPIASDHRPILAVLESR